VVFHAVPIQLAARPKVNCRNKFPIVEGVRTVEQGLHATAADHIEVIDNVPPTRIPAIPVWVASAITAPARRRTLDAHHRRPPMRNTPNPTQFIGGSRLSAIPFS